MQVYQRSLGCVLLLGCFTAAMIGCGEAGPKRAAVTGTVKLDGAAVESGSITFIPTKDSKNPSAAGEIEGGEYNIPLDSGPAAGTYRVEIRWSRPTGKKIEMGSPSPPGTMVDEVKEAIPAKFNSASTLTKDVEAGENTLDFDLTS